MPEDRVDQQTHGVSCKNPPCHVLEVAEVEEAIFRGWPDLVGAERVSYGPGWRGRLKSCRCSFIVLDPRFGDHLAVVPSSWVKPPFVSGRIADYGKRPA